MFVSNEVKCSRYPGLPVILSNILFRPEYRNSRGKFASDNAPNLLARQVMN
jgi:hypothetical protein